MSNPSARLGIHASVRRGHLAGLRAAAALGVGAVQLFPVPPRRWRAPPPTGDGFRAFRAERERLNMETVAVHSVFVSNLATSREALWRHSVERLELEAGIAAGLGADFFIVHPGAHSPDRPAEEGWRRFIQALRDLSRETRGAVKILVENVPGGGRRLGDDFPRLGEAIRETGAGLCLDVSHAWAAGWDLATEEGRNSLSAEIERTVGWASVPLIHVHESAAERGSRLDRHEHLGRGRIGSENLRAFLQPVAAGRTLILETPRNEPGADEANLAALRGLLGP